MKTFAIVNADDGEQLFAYIVSDCLENALDIYARQMDNSLYDSAWMHAHIGSAPYIVTDKVVLITGYECD